MTHSLLLTTGVLLLSLGACFQIWEEWPTRGLTDTSFWSLGCLVGGPACLLVSAYGQTDYLLLAVSLGAFLVGAVLTGWKLKDWARTHLRGSVRPYLHAYKRRR